MSVTQAQANFINASQFAVIGRVLSDRSRWDNKVSVSVDVFVSILFSAHLRDLETHAPSPYLPIWCYPIHIHAC